MTDDIFEIQSEKLENAKMTVEGPLPVAVNVFTSASIQNRP